MTLLSAHLHQLHTATLGLLSTRCGRTPAILRATLPHLIGGLRSGGKEGIQLMMDAEPDEEEASDPTSLPLLPPIQLPSASHPLPVLVSLIRSLGLVHLSIDSRRSLALSHSLVSTLTSLFSHKATANSTRREIASTLASLLTPLTLQPWSPSLSYRAWFTLLTSLYHVAVQWIRKQPKAKNQLVAAPLLVSSLCCCDPEAFIRSFTDSIQQLLLSYHQYRRQPGEGVEAASACIDSLQRLLHVYLLQRASRPETTLTNLEQLHRAFLLSSPAASSLTHNDEDGYAWMRGATQDALVALVLTTALADRDFTAHEIILPMLESQHKRRGAGAAGKEGVSGQVVTGLRALSAVLCVDEAAVAEPHSTHAKQPAPQLATSLPATSLASTLAELRAQLLSSSPAAVGPHSFHNAHAAGGSGEASYFTRLSSIVGVVLQQCDDVVGTEEGKVEGRGAGEEEASMTAFRLALRVMTVVWPTALPLPTTLSILTRASFHPDAPTRQAARLTQSHCMAQPQCTPRGRLLMAVSHHIHGLPLTSPPSPVVDALVHLLGLISRWGQSAPFSSGDVEGLLLHELEAAVGVWLAVVHPLVRLAAVAVLACLRALCHHLAGHRRWPQSPPSEWEGWVGLSGASPTRHHLMDAFDACQCSSSHLAFDSLLPNHSCQACGEAPAAAASDVVLSLTERVERDEARERREAEREVRARHSHSVSDRPRHEDAREVEEEGEGRRSTKWGRCRPWKTRQSTPPRR